MTSPYRGIAQTNMDNLNGYARALRQALERRTPYTAYNRNMSHAEIVVCTALEQAEKEVLLLSESLDRALYGGPWFDFAVADFLERGGRLRILVEREMPEDPPVRSLGSDKVTVRKVAEEMVEGYDCNFMVVDDRGYRFEPTRTEHKAVVSFRGENEEPSGTLEQLTELFELLWRHHSVPI